MDLKQLVIQLEADGFRLIDKGAGLGFGTQLNLRFQMHAGEWQTKITPFEREAPTFWHPFRKSMFVYTGAPPARVIVGLMDGGFTDDLDTGNPQARRAYYQRNNFRSYPDFDDDSWDDYDSRTHFTSSRPHSSSGDVTASASAQAFIPADLPPPPPPPLPTTNAPPPPPPPLDVPLERDDSREPLERDSASSGVAASSEASVSEEILSAASEPSPSDSSTAAADAVGSAASSEPNAY